MKRIIRFFLFLTCIGAGQLTAQTATVSQTEIETFLTQKWIHSPVSSTVDQYVSGKCESGKSYTFAPKGVLEVHECIQNRMRSTRQSWTLSQSEFEEWQIRIGNTVYLLETISKSGQDRLILTPVETQGDELSPISLYRMTDVVEEEGIEEGRE